MVSKQHFARYALIAALVLVFGFFGIDKFLNPLLWIGWIPTWMEGLLGFTRETWLQIIAALEILLAAWLLIPIRRARQIAVVLMALHLVAVLTQTGWNDVGARDTGLLLASVALFLLL